MFIFSNNFRILIVWTCINVITNDLYPPNFSNENDPTTSIFTSSPTYFSRSVLWLLSFTNPVNYTPAFPTVRLVVFFLFTFLFLWPVCCCSFLSSLFVLFCFLLLFCFQPSFLSLRFSLHSSPPFSSFSVCVCACFNILYHACWAPFG